MKMNKEPTETKTSAYDAKSMNEKRLRPRSHKAEPFFSLQRSQER